MILDSLLRKISRDFNREIPNYLLIDDNRPEKLIGIIKSNKQWKALINCYNFHELVWFNDLFAEYLDDNEKRFVLFAINSKT